MRTKLSFALHLATLTLIQKLYPDSCLQAIIKAGSTSESVYKKRSDEADAKLQNCFASTDWNMFRDSSDGIEKCITSVTGFINKCIEDVFPTVTVRTYPNQKTWITGSICTELKARAAAFKELDSNPEAYKKSRYALQQTIKQAKRQYRTKIESYYTGSDTRQMLLGLQTITDYKGKHSREPPFYTSLPE